MVNVRSALESLYSGTCEIINKAKVKNPTTLQISFEDVVTVTGQKCRLSYSSISAVNQESGASTKKQVIKLFLPPDIEVKAGAKIVVNQNGVTKTYKAASEPAVYTNHQEVELTLAGEYV